MRTPSLPTVGDVRPSNRTSRLYDGPNINASNILEIARIMRDQCKLVPERGGGNPCILRRHRPTGSLLLRAEGAPQSA